VIVAIFNGHALIERKLNNLLDQDYTGRVEILIANDASTDGTEALVQQRFAARGVRVISLSSRGGKERAQRAALQEARGEVIVFTDARTRLDRDGLTRIVAPMADPEVGCSSSEDAVAPGRSGGSGEGFYVRYEMATRRLESELGSLVGLSGSFFAIRRELCDDFSEVLPSDFRSALIAVKNGKRAVVAPGAFGYYEDVAAGVGSWNRKVRTIIRGLTTLFAEASLLNPVRFGLFAWQLWSHKLARWTVPFALLAMLVGSGALAFSSRWFLAISIAQLLVWGYAVWMLSTAHQPSNSLGRLIRYFSEANLTALVAWGRFIGGERIVAWDPTAQ
jgi:cellulose synthase/poly-beta-1,6-N-acetylglucosamine synthase-like glycosyltransferase